MPEFYYNGESFAKTLELAKDLATDACNAKSQAEGILSAASETPPELDISGFISNIKSQIEKFEERAQQIPGKLDSLKGMVIQYAGETEENLSRLRENEANYLRNSEFERYIGNISKPNPNDYPDGELDDAYIKALKEYEINMAMREYYIEHKDWNDIKSEWGDDAATEAAYRIQEYDHGYRMDQLTKEGVEKIWTEEAADWGQCGVRIVTGLAKCAEEVLSLGVALNNVNSAIHCVLFGDLDGANSYINSAVSSLSTSYVDDAYNKFYETDAGKWLDENANSTHDSDAARFGIAMSHAVGDVVLACVAGASIGKVGEAINVADDAIDKAYSVAGVAGAAYTGNTNSLVSTAINYVGGKVAKKAGKNAGNYEEVVENTVKFATGTAANYINDDSDKNTTDKIYDAAEKQAVSTVSSTAKKAIKN